MRKNTLIRILVIIVFLVVILYAIACWQIKREVATGGLRFNKYLLQQCTDKKAVFDSKDFLWTKNFRDRHLAILKEFEAYRKEYIVPSYTEINQDLSGNVVGWKSLFLRAFNNDTTIISRFPITKSLIDSCDCTTAYFSVLEPGTKIPPHVGISRGVLRYHLGLIVPDDYKNCFIIVDGVKLHWKVGSDVMFDDLFLHEVQNNTNQQRVVLFLDIKRKFKSWHANLLNEIALKFISCNDQLLTTVDKANTLSKLKK